MVCACVREIEHTSREREKDVARYSSKQRENERVSACDTVAVSEERCADKIEVGEEHGSDRAPESASNREREEGTGPPACTADGIARALGLNAAADVDPFEMLNFLEEEPEPEHSQSYLAFAHETDMNMELQQQHINQYIFRVQMQ